MGHVTVTGDGDHDPDGLLSHARELRRELRFEGTD
jgi:hypothetical protein